MMSINAEGRDYQELNEQIREAGNSCTITNCIEQTTVLLNQSPNKSHILFGGSSCTHLTGKLNICTFSPKDQLAAVHSGAGEIVNDPLIPSVQAQHHENTACLVLSKEAACTTADHQSRNLFSVFFHMDTGAVACVSLNVDLAAPHGIACRITDAAMDHDFARIHGITDCVLCIAVDCDFRPVQIGTQCVSGDAANCDILPG